MQCKDINNITNTLYLIGLYTKPLTGLFKCTLLDNDKKNKRLIIKIDEVLYSEIQFTNNLLIGFFEIDFLDPRYIIVNDIGTNYITDFYINLHKQNILSTELKLKAFTNNLIAIEKKLKNE
jgi:hypothetical protein